MTVAAIVPAAGRGARFGGPENKIWVDIGGRPLIQWTLRALETHPGIDSLVIVGAPDELDRLRDAAAAPAKPTRIVAGGATRAESVLRGLESLDAGVQTVLVHDAARPAVPPDLIDRVLAGVRSHGAAIPGMPCTDTAKVCDPQGRVEATLDRSRIALVQTPQGCRRDLLERAYRVAGAAANGTTDEASLLERADIPVHVVAGDAANVKVTLLADLAAVRRALIGRGSGEVRTGLGYDVHRLASGRELWLGGVRIEHDQGLEGHSDADVVVHAVCDALLGAAGLGDIGLLFPPGDPAHRNRRSTEFLAEIGPRLRAAGWLVTNIDAAVLAEAPRLAPHRTAMAEAMAQALELEAKRISIKATTSEGLGPVGRREGIGCWAVATLQRAEEQ
ncbi:MAG: 2-C-methyl-D-erythritol 4-phosphate cytidylyltransferase [Armatimonadetes bacterium]|nr:2-C-methyl-D-erythritol 4-phosphate cytidylyltransferase [Armatimonadota bacterium]